MALRATSISRQVSWIPFAGACLVVLVLGAGSIRLIGPDVPVAVWWPVAGVAVAALLWVRAPSRPAASLGIWVVAASAHYLGGRPLQTALLYGLANALQALVVASVLTFRREAVTLRSVRDVLRLMFAAALGAAVVATAIGLWAWREGDENLGTLLLAVFWSHVTALMTVVPLFIGGAERIERRRIQWVLQPALVLVASLLIFRPPGVLPLVLAPVALLPLPLLVWAAFVFPVRLVAAQLVAFAVLVLGFVTLDGDRVLPTLSDDVTRVALIQGFLVTYVASVLLVAGACAERRTLAETVTQHEQLLRGVIRDSYTGMIILRQVEPSIYHVAQANERAVELFDHAVPPVLGRPEVPVVLERGSAGPVLGEVLGEVLGRMGSDGRRSWRGEVGTPSGRRLDLVVDRVPRRSGNHLVTIQVIDVTARHEASMAGERALRDEKRAATELRALNRQKDDFVSAVSHELRTPVTSIVGFAELLKEADLPGDHGEFAEVIHRNARRLNALVEDLLAIGAGRAHQRPRVELEVPPVVREVVDDHAGVAERGGIALQVRTEGDDASLVAVAHRGDLARIVTNLVTNAIKFTSSGGRVDVTVDRAEEGVRIIVHDTGTGIAEEDLERVFEQFYRTERAEEHAIPGTGLGLALVKELVTAGDGTVRVESDGNSWTAVTVILPAPGESTIELPDRRPDRAVDPAQA